MNINRNLYYNFILRLSLNLLFILTAAFCFNYSTVQAALNSDPTDWDNFTFFELTLNGIPLRDVELSQDPTNGGTGVQPDRIDISSGYDGTNGDVTNCNPSFPPADGHDECGLESSAYWAYYVAGTTWDGEITQPNTSMADDYIAFRMRMAILILTA